jgi:hypothetical protein
VLCVHSKAAKCCQVDSRAHGNGNSPAAMQLVGGFVRTVRRKLLNCRPRSWDCKFTIIRRVNSLHSNGHHQLPSFPAFAFGMPAQIEIHAWFYSWSGASNTDPLHCDWHIEHLISASHRHGIWIEMTPCCVLIYSAYLAFRLRATAALALRLFRFETTDVRFVHLCIKFMMRELQRLMRYHKHIYLPNNQDQYFE